MQERKSLCPSSSREYLGIDSFPMQISKDKNDITGLRKVHIQRDAVRIENNRIVFELTKDQLKDLGNIIAVFCPRPRVKAKAKKKVAKAKK